jgi:type III restriction enzyme
MELREVESAKISCARKHFQAISSDKVIFDAVKNYQELMNLVK